MKQTNIFKITLKQRGEKPDISFIEAFDEYDAKYSFLFIHWGLSSSESKDIINDRIRSTKISAVQSSLVEAESLGERINISHNVKFERDKLK